MAIHGFSQRGYIAVYLLAIVFARVLVNTTSPGWCPLVAFKRHWILLAYLVLLVAGFNFMSHGSQDLYLTMCKNQFAFLADEVAVTQVVANLGAITGGTLVGYHSQIIGRRLSIIVMAVIARRVVWIHLMELSPPSYSTLIVGTSHQLGNVITSASSALKGIAICVFMTFRYANLVLLTCVCLEARGEKFDITHDNELEEAAHKWNGGTSTRYVQYRRAQHNSQGGRKPQLKKQTEMTLE
ncbi:hypothetical protein PHYSODRAFT_336181 [Phytophthora sojae]|uniref:Major facilitator superfamily (MFS) profile domain-containing protein n=1 Tax=Phytophthora sojae (strain P6497) TaxID=1094619 RepID=G4ZWK4_PHYSP|nr:hypothetical protein PHYSODRAFT_336181 [Phytophthora sojae]EGZ11678.1 hypothetical protein PHYSODRAFT_336181 [Phytophthora sojae]|eukprot:XP_009532011.1 hypothetical protein PHYSODRAFT_336181 [Phytophthora sojae]